MAIAVADKAAETLYTESNPYFMEKFYNPISAV